MASELVDVPTEKLMAEVQRRLNCQLKPQKRVILVGAAVRRMHAVQDDHC